LTSRYSLADDVVLASLPGGTSLLLDLNGNVYAVSEKAAVLLRLALGSGREALQHHLVEPNGPDAPRDQADVDAFLHDLQSRGLLCPRGQHARRRRGGLIASLVLVPALWLAHRALLPPRARVWVLLALARLSFFLFGWARTVRAWRLGHRAPAPPAQPGAWERAILVTDDLVRRVAHAHLLHMECKERALCSWSLLRTAGWPASLVVGIEPFPISGHCWCESGDSVVGDAGGYSQSYTSVIRHH
jgi:hypothetical protein